MSDTSGNDAESSRGEEQEEEIDDGPLLSFEFEDEPMPHWSEPGSGEKPSGGERPDPPYVERTSLGRSRLFPQLPDDPHLVDTSDTGLMDAVRSDTIPTLPPAQEPPTIDSDSESQEPEKKGEFIQTEASTDELFNDSLFDEEEVFDPEVFDDAPIIGRLLDEGEPPTYDTGPIEELEIESVPEDRGGAGADIGETTGELLLGDDEEPMGSQEVDPPAQTEAGETTAELLLGDDEEPVGSQEVDPPAQTEPEELSSVTESHEPPRPAPKVIELFDTPPSQRTMDSGGSVNAGDARGQERFVDDIDGDDSDWSQFGGPAPHWREGRRDYEEPKTVNQDERVVTSNGADEEVSGSSEGTGGRNLPAAIGVGLALAAAFFGLLKVGSWAILIMVLVALGLAALEFFTSAQNLGYRPATLLGLAAVVGLPLGAYHRGFEAYPIVFALLLVTGMCWFLFDVESQHVTANLAVTLLGVCWVGGLGSFAALILARQHGDAILIGAVLGTIAYDIGGYVIGSTTGQSKIAPRVSPNKTYEGLIGGMLLSIVVTTLVLNRFPGVYPWSASMLDCFWLGIAIAAVAPIGDLAQSMIKRDMGVKDMGTLLPGHGGIFDRFDALLFVLPATYFVADLVLS